MRLVVLVAALGGCGFSEFAPGGDDPIPPGDAGPDGALPDAGIDAPDGPLDTDSDSVLDADDNCPTTPNPDQHDEDLDGNGGDACDLCPHLPAAQTDGDGDGIGADCDPRPMLPGDQLALFEGFNAASVGPPSGWSATGGGAWSVAEGKLTHIAVDNNAGTVTLALPGGAGDHTVDATGTLVSALLDPTSVFGVITDFASPPGELYQCAVREDNPQAELFRYFAPTNTWTPLQTAGQTITVGESYRIVGRASAGGQSCRAAGATLVNTGNTFNGTRVGFRVREMTVSIPYVAIYRSP